MGSFCYVESLVCLSECYQSFLLSGQPDTEAKTRYIEGLQASQAEVNAFWCIETLFPSEHAIPTMDSPVGMVAWMYLLMRQLSPGYHWGLEELITWSKMYTISGPYGGV